MPPLTRSLPHRGGRRRCPLARAALLAACAWAAAADAQPTAPAAAASPFDPPIMSPRPAGLATPRLVTMWRRGLALERERRFLEAASHYEAMTRTAPRVAYSYWKLSRNYWRHAESLPIDAKEERLPFFRLARDWAARGLEIDPHCAECMLWKFGAMGRIGTTQGIVRSAGMGREMATLLDRGIALAPSYRDDPTNSTLGNLYYAGGVFYRIVPEWRWLQWFVGVRGDIDRSLQMIRRANEIDRDRIDYHVELGAVLLCYAERRGEDWARTEARRVLERTTALPRRFASDESDLEHARTLLGRPHDACGFSRDGWIDMEAERRKAER